MDTNSFFTNSNTIITILAMFWPLVLLFVAGKTIRINLKARKKGVFAIWKGNYIIQGQNAETIEIEFKRNWLSVILGDGKIKGENIKCRGKFLTDNILMFSYINKDATKIQVGSLILKYSDNGKKLEGSFSGYGHNSSATVNGSVLLNRQ